MENISEVALADVKQYMKVDGTDDDRLIETLYGAARTYLKDGGVEKPEKESDLYTLALWGLTLHYYDHRDDVGTNVAIPIGLRNIINQLKQTGEILRSVTN